MNHFRRGSGAIPHWPEEELYETCERRLSIDNRSLFRQSRPCFVHPPLPVTVNRRVCMKRTFLGLAILLLCGCEGEKTTTPVSKDAQVVFDSWYGSHPCQDYTCTVHDGYCKNMGGGVAYDVRAGLSNVAPTTIQPSSLGTFHVTTETWQSPYVPNFRWVNEDGSPDSTMSQ